MTDGLPAGEGGRGIDSESIDSESIEPGPGLTDSQSESSAESE